MRDPKRIHRFCKLLADLWLSECPDMRFGQLMTYVMSKCDDIFYVEDDILAERLKEIIKKRKT